MNTEEKLIFSGIITAIEILLGGFIVWSITQDFLSGFFTGLEVFAILALVTFLLLEDEDEEE